MRIAMVLGPGFTALDVVGPYEVLRIMPGVDVRFVSNETGPVLTDSGVLTLGATHTFADTPSPDLVLVPGMPLQTSITEELVDWLRRVHPGTSWTTSVCGGSVFLAMAGILAGRPATSHWIALPLLANYGAEPRPDERIVHSGKIVTSAGVSAGIDLALWLAGEVQGREWAEAVQLMIEYDPRPPFDSGHMSKASQPVRDLAMAEMARLYPQPVAR
ncbi:DJ-1/PfpI family protein [Pseudonocardia acaciae]|uniref:DJ-1/PfpI family protein n=1 Tax=Pseudonocardia acaciae TaxID=551276 RepID=UPI000560E6DF|nr:DJ-1/PfpI family protein [Pseudonocardia acaciae]